MLTHYSKFFKDLLTIAYKKYSFILIEKYFHYAMKIFEIKSDVFNEPEVEEEERGNIFS